MEVNASGSKLVGIGMGSGAQGRCGGEIGIG